MNLNLDSGSLKAYIQDWDQAGWDAQSGTIPWNYTIEITPSVPDDVLNGLNTGRQLMYDQRNSYVTEWYGNTMVVRPVVVFVQQLLPLPSDPSTTV